MLLASTRAGAQGEDSRIGWKLLGQKAWSQASQSIVIIQVGGGVGHVDGI